jgi:hypothetical protein
MVLDSDLKNMIDINPSLFKDNQDCDFLVLAIFIFYELCKGKDSFWYPYLLIAEDPDLPSFWKEEELKEL